MTAHLLRLHDQQHPSQILRNSRAEQQVIKMLPLRDFLARTQPPYVLKPRLQAGAIGIKARRSWLEPTGMVSGWRWPPGDGGTEWYGGPAAAEAAPLRPASCGP